MADTFPITLIKKIYEKVAAAAVVGGTLEDVETVDWGGFLPPEPSMKFPMIFITFTSAMWPEMRAAQGAEEAYDESYRFVLNVYCYGIKPGDVQGYRSSLEQATNIARNLVTLCHINKVWDNLCYTSEIAEVEEAVWGNVEFGDGKTAYGIGIPLLCVRKSTT